MVYFENTELFPVVEEQVLYFRFAVVMLVVVLVTVAVLMLVFYLQL
jgi:hypothetical protein